MNKSYSVMIIALILSSLFLTSSYAISTDCYDGNVFYVWQLNDVLICIEDMLTNHESRITTLETSGTDLTTASNLGSIGEGVFSTEVGNDLQFKKITNGTGITLSANGTRIMINSTASGGGDLTTASNLGAWGAGVFASEVGNDLQFRKIVSTDSCLGVTNNSTSVNLDTTESCEEKLIFQVSGDVYSSVTKTNIGTAYVDIYTSAFDEEDMMYIDCQGVTFASITYIWDYVGVGTQQLRWINSQNNSQVFYESPTFTSDRDAVTSGFFAKPSWCVIATTIEWQGKSTTAGDDPIAKGYKIMVN